MKKFIYNSILIFTLLLIGNLRAQQCSPTLVQSQFQFSNQGGTRVYFSGCGSDVIYPGTLPSWITLGVDSSNSLLRTLIVQPNSQANERSATINLVVNPSQNSQTYEIIVNQAGVDNCSGVIIPDIPIAIFKEGRTTSKAINYYCNSALNYENVPSWVSSISVGWSYSSGGVIRVLNVVADTNNGTTGRTAKIRCYNDNVDFFVYVAQSNISSGGEGFCSRSFEKSEVMFSEAGEALSNYSTHQSSGCTGGTPTVDTSLLPDWLSVNYYYMTSRPYAYVTTQQNTGASRSAQVVVISGAYISTFIVSQDGCTMNSWYPDSDGDGYGDYNSTSVMRTCLPVTQGYATNNWDRCRNTYSSSNKGCPEGYEIGELNSVSTEVRNISGQVKAKSISYFDELGRNIQNQTTDFKRSKVIGTQILYDKQGRRALNTLAAPMSQSTSFYGYAPDFIKNANNEIYSWRDFEFRGLEPNAVGNELNTLGREYSSLNTDEPNQDITDRPYTRTLYSKLIPGAVKQTIGGNKLNGEWRQGYTFSMPAAQELYYAFGYNMFPSNPDIATTYEGINTVLTDDSNKIVWLKSSKTVVQDITGTRESVVFTDADGKTLGAARSGGTQYEVLSLIGEQKFIDIHIPLGCGNTATFLNGASNYKVYNLKEETLITPTPNTLQPGFYRVEYIGATNLTKEHQLSYIDTEVTTTTNKIKSIKTNAVGIRYKVNYHAFSLNEYNDVGQLTSTLQPLGFNDACLSGLSATVSHDTSLKSSFKYNVLGQLIETESPDEGTARFKYRNDGQIRFSQNSKQLANSEFSYSNYDDLGRPIESGVSTGNFSSLNPDSVDFTGARSEQHFTEYDYLNDNSHARLNSLVTSSFYQNPTFLSGNVARSYNKDSNGSIISETYYSYDVYGRVRWIVQNLQGLGVKIIDYRYDPITGQVTKVYYQKGQSDQFIHRYTYDSDDQSLVKVETSVNDTSFTEHAEYRYYKTTGALKRITLAEGLQEIDYVYNVAGQLKSINHPSLAQDNDVNRNGTDLFGVTLDYYAGDYQRSTNFTSNSNLTVDDQYSGNIKAMTWNSKQNTTDSHDPVLYEYEYDERNFLKNAKFNGLNSQQRNYPADLVLDHDVFSTEHRKATNSITMKPGFHVLAVDGLDFTAQIVSSNANGVYKAGDYNVSNLTYDANGNILSLTRNKNSEMIDGVERNEMDKLTYRYKANKPNQLQRVDDAVVEDTHANDIKDQTTTDNYKYNSIGQLTENIDEDVKYEYNASGLVTKVRYNNKVRVEFLYNDKGFRTKKLSYKVDGTLDKTTDYVLDASGSAMAIYENQQLKELPIYGASRLGIYNKATGTSVYQLTDHLGNVRAVIAKNGDQAIASSTTDYYPFGMPMPNRQIINGEPYRYAYQGQEKDPETGKEAFQLRLWDARIGRWLTTDPKREFSSPYLGMGNNPLNKIDPDGGSTAGPDDWVRGKGSKLFYWDENINSKKEALAKDLEYGGKDLHELKANLGNLLNGLDWIRYKVGSNGVMDYIDQTSYLRATYSWMGQKFIEMARESSLAPEDLVERSQHPYIEKTWLNGQIKQGDWEDTVTIAGVELEVTFSKINTVDYRNYVTELRPRLNGRQIEMALYADQGKSRRGFNFTNSNRGEVGVLWITFKTNKDFHFATSYIYGEPIKKMQSGFVPIKQ